MARVDICICTFRRPFLAATLKSVAGLDLGGHAVRVIVADNDASPSARALVTEVSAAMPMPVTYVHAPRANICVARNACLDAADADYVAFVDDDEVVSKGWLVALMNKAEASGAVAVLGPVRALYDAAAPAWMAEGDFHSTRPVYVDGRIRTGYTCNVLIRWTAPFSSLRFDPALGRSGGEDTDFFYRLTGLGGMIDYAPEALVEEPVTEARASMDWLVQRRLRFGQTHGMLLAGSPLRVLPVVAAKISYCLLMTGLTAFSPVLRRRNWLRAVLHMGVVRGLLGLRQAEHYGRTA
ncbi:glycosyl transferase family A [Nostoc sp. 3335mG]|nr:glycosyl transferase family A [Nostoc sp. 3335mG]